MEERERRRSPRTRGSDRAPGPWDRRTRARDSSDPLYRERGRSGGRVSREGGSRPRPRDSSAPLIREGSRSQAGGRFRSRDSSAPSPRKGWRARTPSEPPSRSRRRTSESPLKRKEGRSPGRGSTRGHSDLRDRPPGSSRSGAPRDALPGEETSGLVSAGTLSNDFTREGIAPPSRKGRHGPRGEDRGRAMPRSLSSNEISQAPGLGYKGLPRDLSPEDSCDSPPGPQLDVSSDQFDPLLALYSPKLPLPFPQARAFNNLAEYESFQRRGVGPNPRRSATTKIRKSKKPLPDPERVERLKNLVVVQEEPKPRPPRRGNKGPKNVLTRMSLNEGSPLGELHRCVRDRVKVNIHIRTFKGMRGVCSGFLVAFDKFWNMALTDVDETYRKPVLGKAFSNEPQLTLTKLFDRLKLQESSKTTSEVSAEAKPTKSSTSKEEPRYGTVPRRHDSAGQSNKSLRVQKEDEDSPPEHQLSKTLRSKSESRSSAGVKAQTLTRPTRPKVDYQQVHARHINQMFIRGENILLIHLAQ